MNFRMRIIVVNVSICAGLLIMYFRGSDFIPIVIAGIFLFIFSNVLIAIKHKNHNL
jgi:membrane-bound ClpP family serine protease